MLGEELSKARQAKGLSQEDLAIQAGLTCEYISKLENNHASPTLDTLLSLCSALGIKASQLIAKIEQWPSDKINLFNSSGSTNELRLVGARGLNVLIPFSVLPTRRRWCDLKKSRFNTQPNLTGRLLIYSSLIGIDPLLICLLHR